MIKRIRQIAQLVSFREIRNAFLGLTVVFGGLGLAFLTIYAHRTGNIQLAGLAAAASLAFVILIVIFVIPPLARSASAEASQLNLPFDFTTGGAIVIGLSVIVAFAAWNTGNNLLFLVLSFFASGLIVSFAAGNICLRKLDVKMRFPETIFAGEKTPIMVGLTNRKRLLPTYSVTAEVRGKERKYSKYIGEFRKVLSEKWAKKLARPPMVKHTLDYFVFVPRRDSIENKAEHIFENRGRFMIRDFELSTRFPFGFFRHRRRLPAQKAEIIVFPKVEELTAELLDLPLDTGRMISAKRGSGQDLFSLREYQPTDDFRHIDWKATARTSQLTVREFTAEDEKRVTVVFDPCFDIADTANKKSLRQKISEEQSGGKPSEAQLRFEAGISKAASILLHFNRDKAEVRLCLEENESHFGSDWEHLNGLLKNLAVLDPQDVPDDPKNHVNTLFQRVFEERRDSHIFFVSPKNEAQIPGEVLKRANLVTY